MVWLLWCQVCIGGLVIVASGLYWYDLFSLWYQVCIGYCGVRSVLCPCYLSPGTPGIWEPSIDIGGDIGGLAPFSTTWGCCLLV